MKNETMNERLKRARLAAGFRTASDAISRFGWRGSTYRAHENGQNHFDAETAGTYARAYGVSAGWLLTGDGIPGGKASVSRRVDGGLLKSDFQKEYGASSSIPLVGVVAAGVWTEVRCTD